MTNATTSLSVETVSSLQELNDAIIYVDQAASGNFAINIAQGATIEIASAISALSLQAGVQLTINGNGATLNGADPSGNSLGQRGLFVYSGSVTINDLTIENTVALGGNGGSGSTLVSDGGGGGGAGLGGGLFVGSNGAVAGDVTLSNVNFINDSAIGGNGGVVSEGGQGGGGGGGLGGGGGSGSGQGAGGGGGIGGSGGNGGEPGASGIIPGVAGGGGGATAYAISFNADDDPSISETAGGIFGGGGGGGILPSGMWGGTGGGGGGVAGSTTGTGGFGGGGGGGAEFGASGGFGGGGGGGYLAAGSGGFGGGGGGSMNGGYNAQGGLGGGEGGATSGLGGGGLGAGGDIFVQNGASLTITGGSALESGSVIGGAGYQAGDAFGGGIFIQNGTLEFGAGQVAGQTTLISGVIADTSSADDPTGVGQLMIDGAGVVVLSANNTYSGGTVIQSGMLEISATGTAGSGAIEFDGAGSELRIDANASNGSTFANSLTNFTAFASLDLAGLTYAPGAQASLSGSTLAVTSDGVTEYFELSGSFASQYSVFEDAFGSTFLSAADGIAIPSGGTAAGGYIAIGAGQTAQQTTVVSGIISNSSAAPSHGNEIVICGDGTVEFSAANSYSGGTLIQSGALEITHSGSAGTGAVEFAGEGTELRLDAAAVNNSTFDNGLTNFTPSDILDLAGLTYTTDAYASLSGNTLSVISDGVTENFVLGGTFAARYIVSEDNHGGVLVSGLNTPSIKQGSTQVDGVEYARTAYSVPNNGIVFVSTSVSTGTQANRFFGSSLSLNTDTNEFVNSSAGYGSTLNRSSYMRYVFTPNSAQDVLDLSPGFGQATVVDLNTSGTNVVDTSGLFANFAEAQGAMATHGARTILTDSEGDRLVLVGFSAGQLQSSNLGFR